MTVITYDIGLLSERTGDLDIDAVDHTLNFL
jgi:hypothetical protein